MENLLQRRLGAHTQNSNESVNSCIWLLAPKHLHSGKNVIDIATYLAVMIFNEGYEKILETMDTMEITFGPIAEMCAARLDEDRINRSEQRVSDAAKRARIEQCEQRIAQRESLLEQEDELYGPGTTD